MLCYSVGAGNCCVFFFQAEDGIRDLVRSRGLGDVYKRQEGIFAGISSGGGMAVALRIASQVENAVIVSIVCDLSLIHI